LVRRNVSGAGLPIADTSGFDFIIESQKMIKEIPDQEFGLTKL
jgi:hypothetical protein